MHTYTYISTPTHSYTHTYTYTHLHIHTPTHSYLYLHTHIHTYTNTHTYLHTYTQTYTHISIHTHIHTHLHTHTHTQIRDHDHYGLSQMCLPLAILAHMCIINFLFPRSSHVLSFSSSFFFPLSRCHIDINFLFNSIVTRNKIPPYFSSP
jgi:hypothetical protein